MTRWSFFAQALTGSLLAVLIAVSAGLYVSQRNVETEFARILAEETRHLAGGIALLLEGNSPTRSFYELAEHVDRRITVVSTNGKVLADSAIGRKDVGEVENHLQRPEVQQALTRGWGWSTRKSSTTGDDYLYVAVHDSPHDRLVRVAVPLAEYQSAVGAINYGVIAGVFWGGALAIVAAFAFASRLQRQLRALIEVARKRSAGEKAAFPESGNEDFHSLASALSEMTRQLDNRLHDLENERTRLRAVLDNMTEGVILCNQHGAIVLWNEAFLELFACEESPAGKKLIELTRIPEVVKMSESVLHEQAPKLLEFQSHDKEIQAIFVPLPARSNEGYLAVFHDITELRRVDRIRRDFVANVSHELRTPLASIAGYAETLLEGAIADTTVAKPFVEGIHRNADRLTHLIEDLLDLARIESGRYSLQFDSIAVRAAVEAAAEVVEKVKLKHHTFKNEVPPQLRVWADRKALIQVLVNLIDNAAKYSPPESTITVQGSEEGGTGVIKISDQGQGIPPEDLPRIFERFYRTDKSRNAAREPGTGLGLAICKHLVSEMGGAIGAESTGRGSTFITRLPLRRPV